MELLSQKTVINIGLKQYQNWKSYLKKELKKINSNNIEINCNNLELTCKDIISIIQISNESKCEIVSFCSTCPKTLVSSQSLGYPSQLITESLSNYTFQNNNDNLEFSQTHFHKGTVRSGEYLETPGNLLILGDVNPGAIVSAGGNVMVWGRLLGIAHAGKEGNAQAKIAALELRPVQLRIASKIARGPKENPQPGLAEQATIDSEKIIISPLQNI